MFYFNIYTKVWDFNDFAKFSSQLSGFVWVLLIDIICCVSWSCVYFLFDYCTLTVLECFIYHIICMTGFTHHVYS